MPMPAPRSQRFFALAAPLSVAAAIFSPLASEAFAIPPRAERVADRIAERRYARMSIAEARVARAEARVAEIAPVVPVPPPPRPATLRRMARAGVPLGGPTPPVVAGRAAAGPPVVATRPAPRPAVSAATARQPGPSTTAARPTPPPPATEPGAWTLGPDEGVAPAAAEIAPDGTRSVLSAGGSPPAPTGSPEPATPASGRSGPAVTEPPIELLPTPEAK